LNENEREYVAYNEFFMLKDSKFSVLAEVSEDEVEIVNDATEALNGVVHRRRKSDMTNSTFGSDCYGYYLHPYY